MNVDIALSKSGHVDAAVEDFFHKLSNVSETMKHFPKLQALTELGPNRFQLDLKKIGAAGVEHGVVFATDFEVHPENNTLKFTAVPNVGNAEISGVFTATPADNGSEFSLDISGTLNDIKVPMLLRGPAKPFIKMQFESIVERFVERLIEDYS